MTVLRTGEGISSRLSKDALVATVAVVICLPVGLLINSQRRQPLGWDYQAPYERLAEGLSSTEGSPSDPERLRFVTVAEAASALEQRSAIFVDARDKDFFDLGHIPGAVNLSRTNFRGGYSGFLRGTKKEDRLIVYCSEADCTDSSHVAKALLRLGFADVVVMEGGWAEWTAAGFVAGDLPQ